MTEKIKYKDLDIWLKIPILVMWLIIVFLGYAVTMAILGQIFR
jgi:hypothetical protein